MSGFFTKKETKSDSRPDGKTYSCISCGRYQDAKSPKMINEGAFKKGILNIITAPSQKDDASGKAFNDKSAKLLEKAYKKVGIDLHEDCMNTYANRCMSATKATAYQTDCCRKNIMRLIKKHKPRIIVLFGNEALYSVIGNRWKKDLGNINKWRGWKIPDQELNAWICPTFSADYILDSKTPVEEVIWGQDLQKVSELINKEITPYMEPEIVYLKKDLSILNSITSGEVAFDYEATGLKPHAKGHKIICASVAVNANKVFTFMIPKKRKHQKPFLDLLQRKGVGKIAANIKFEDTWTNVILKIPVIGWLWDTMQAAHIIDNRPGITGLKFQTYVQFGIIDYDSDVEYYLKAEDKGNGNAINRIEKLIETKKGAKDLLKYCAYDSVYEYRLSEYQRTYMLTKGKTPISPKLSDFPKAYKLFHEGILALAQAERNGLRIDVKYAKKKKEQLTKKIKKLENKIYESKFYRHWQHTTKSKVNLNSGLMLGNFLYKVKKIKPARLTDTGKGSTDEESLAMLNIPELNWIIERSKLLKVRDTYLGAFIREQVDGYIHPFFNLHLVRSYRSSSNNPNFQNIPKRDKTTMTLVRKAIIPREGHQLMEMDFKGIEVGVATCFHKDPNMIKYITDPKTDMHGDMATQIFKIDDWDRSRDDHNLLRAATKNSFIFPQFYGDYYGNNAKGFCSSWLNLPEGSWDKSMGFSMKVGTIAKHLLSKGIKSYDLFVKHIKKIENHFWNVRFKKYGKWKKDHYADYEKNGYISLKTGFVCKGVMSYNEVSNYGTQGTAFHLLLWVFTRINEHLIENGYKTRLVGQIHDAIVFDAHPKEVKTVYHLVTKMVTRDLPEAFPWINVPLSIDAELCPVNGSWDTKEEWKPESEAKTKFRKGFKKMMKECDATESDIY